MKIIPVPAFSDNYIWLVHDEESGDTAVVDPGDGAAALAAAEQRGWRISQVWNTHWHRDHTGGNLVVKDATDCTISAPVSDRIPGVDVVLREGDGIRIGSHVGRILEVPGHTLDHIAIIFEAEQIAFVGDTMFAMGCGRLFEGTPEQMYASLHRLTGLAPETQIYCAHEYTLSNARFAAHVDAGNQAVVSRLQEVTALREEGRITLPTTVAQERATNPFVRAADTAEFASLRAQKDSFHS